jgi:hypothetical protein
MSKLIEPQGKKEQSREVALSSFSVVKTPTTLDEVGEHRRGDYTAGSEGDRRKEK